MSKQMDKDLKKQMQEMIDKSLSKRKSKDVSAATHLPIEKVKELMLAYGVDIWNKIARGFKSFHVSGPFDDAFKYGIGAIGINELESAVHHAPIVISSRKSSVVEEKMLIRSQEKNALERINNKYFSDESSALAMTPTDEDEDEDKDETYIVKAGSGQKKRVAVGKLKDEPKPKQFKTKSATKSLPKVKTHPKFHTLPEDLKQHCVDKGLKNGIMEFDDLVLFYEAPEFQSSKIDVSEIKEEHRKWWEQWRVDMWIEFFPSPRDFTQKKCFLMKSQRKLLSLLALKFGVATLAKQFNVASNEKLLKKDPNHADPRDCFYFYDRGIKIDHLSREDKRAFYKENYKQPFKSKHVQGAKTNFWKIMTKTMRRFADRPMTDDVLDYEEGFIKAVVEAHRAKELEFDQDWQKTSKEGFWKNVLKSNDTQEDDEGDEQEEDDEGDEHEEDDEGDDQEEDEGGDHKDDEGDEQEEDDEGAEDIEETDSFDDKDPSDTASPKKQSPKKQSPKKPASASPKKSAAASPKKQQPKEQPVALPTPNKAVPPKRASDAVAKSVMNKKSSSNIQEIDSPSKSKPPKTPKGKATKKSS